MVKYSEIVNEVDEARPSEKGQELWLEEKELAVTASELMEDTDNLRRMQGTSDANPLEIEEWSQEIINLGDRFIEAAKTIGNQVRNDETIDPSPVFNDLNGIIKNDLVEQLYEYTMCELEEKDIIPRHSVDVTFVSLMIGKGMGYEPKKQLILGLAAFFSNVGMYKISDEVLNQDGKIEKKEKKVFKNYPKVSFDILNGLEKRYKWLAEVALQIHERADGSGHPNGLKGKEINKLASIIGLVNVYVEMTRDGHHGDNVDQTDAIKYIVDEAKNLFPRKVRKAFLDQVTLFPINSFVILNNQSIGRVLRTNKKWTLRPTIELLYNSQGDKLEQPKIIRLMENPLLYIKGSVNPNDLP
jgi:HD-GYP domain-containing protein (c-di-GMP phosphodiesterase class II)